MYMHYNISWTNLFKSMITWKLSMSQCLWNNIWKCMQYKILILATDREKTLNFKFLSSILLYKECNWIHNFFIIQYLRKYGYYPFLYSSSFVLGSVGFTSFFILNKALLKILSGQIYNPCISDFFKFFVCQKSIENLGHSF